MTLSENYINSLGANIFLAPQKFLIILLTIHVSADKQKVGIHTTGRPSGRIIGGINAKDNEFPFMVSISRIKKREHYDICGGTYIHKYWVLTAAHCTKPDVTYRLYIGVTYSALMKNRFAAVRNATYVVVHPEYRIKPTLQNDLALMSIDSPFGGDSNLLLIPRYFNYAPNTEVLTIGFGATKLQDLKQNKTTPLRLQKLYSKIKVREYNIDPNTFFIGAFGKNVCFGDSGGPIIFNGGLIGVVSSIGTTPEKNCKATYARAVKIVMYRTWINSVLLDKNDTLHGKGVAPSHLPQNFYVYMKIIIMTLLIL